MSNANKNFAKTAIKCKQSTKTINQNNFAQYATRTRRIIDKRTRNCN